MGLKMVLMEFKTSGGESGRCDAKCYEAKEKICKCCCGGKNHGVGLRQAIENTKRDLIEMLEWAEKNGFVNVQVSKEIRFMLEQGDLFGEFH
jgi:hypothetical protein